MQVIAVISQKGGAGKTTLTLCLAVAAHRAGKSVLVIDLDPQSSAAIWGDARTDDAPVVVSAQPARLGPVLEAASREGAELVLIDTPPRASDSQLAAAKVADLVLVPFRPTNLDLQTVSTTLDVVKLGGSPPVLGVLNAIPSRGPARIEAEQFVTALNLQLCACALGHRMVFDQAIGHGQTPQETEPGGKAAQEIEALYEIVRRTLDGEEGSER